ncbi:hypothetical protein V3C99_004034 [Haemonchus contortus]
MSSKPSRTVTERTVLSTTSKSSATTRSSASTSSPTPPSGTKAQSPVPVFPESGKGIVDTGESKRRQNIKRFFFRIKESIGMVEKTEISKAFTESLTHMDKYKLCLDTVFEALCAAIQENPSLRIGEYKTDLLPHDGHDRHELVAACLRNQSGLEDYKNHKTQMELYDKLGEEQRDYIRKAKRSIENIQTFIKHDYWAIGAKRTELEKLRREMDFTKAELKAAKDAQLIAIKNNLHNMAVSAFEEKLRQVTALVDELPKNKATHFAELEGWVSCTLEYHQKMAQLNRDAEKG